MVRFDSFKSLQKFLRTDLNQASHSPIRFINVESLEMWMEVKKLLQSMVSNTLFLSNLCEDEDTTPNIKRLKLQLKNQVQSIYVSPLSEYLRVNPEIAQSTVRDLLTREYSDSINNHYRIYIPMYRMKSIFQAISLNDPRKDNCVLLLETGEDTDYSLTIIQNSLHVNIPGNSIYGFKRYLQYWEQNPDKPIILYTDNAIYFEHNLFFDNVRVIVTSYDLLEYHYNLPPEFLGEDGTVEQWDNLARTIATEKDFTNACCTELMINRYNFQLFERWNRLNSYHKWLLWLWTRTQNYECYTVSCAKKAHSVEEFINIVYCNIIAMLNSPNFVELYNDRKQLLKELNSIAPEIFWDSISTLEEIDQIRVLTDCSSKEREYIFELLTDRSFDERDSILKVLYTSYPLLANYLSSEGNLAAGVLSDLHQKYFNEYRWGKITNTISKEFYDLVTDIAKQDGETVYQLQARNAIISDQYIASESTIVFVDGMGIEYIELIAYVLSEMDLSQFNCVYQVGYCILPSTTEVNKDFLANRKVALETLELDELKHGTKYFPDNIVAELDFISTLKEKVLNAFSSGINRVILTSDHGTSRLAVLVRQTQFDNKIPAQNLETYKYGRYCIGTSLSLETAIEYDGKTIFADYSRFEQKGAPIDEIHGGASLEEWLVPIVTIQRRDAVTLTTSKKVLAKVCLLTDNVQKNRATQMVTIKFKLENVSPTIMNVSVNEKTYSCQKLEDVFQFSYKPQADEKEIQVYLKSDKIEGSFTVKINSGIGRNEAFDI